MANMGFQNGILGSRIQNPFVANEYVTITGQDTAKNRLNIVDQRGKTGSIGSEVLGSEYGKLGSKAVSKASASVYKAPQFDTPSGVNSLEGTKVASETLDKGPSVVEGSGQVATIPGEKAPLKQPPSSSTLSTYDKMQMGLAGVEFLVDIINANSAYNTLKGQAQLNILMARNQGADALYRGHQAQMGAQSQGMQAGQDALLNAAAQGQSVTGAATQKIQGSYNAIGIYNGMQEEINSMREALGYQLEEVNYEYQIANAGIARENAILGSGLKTAATIGMGML